MQAYLRARSSLSPRKREITLELKFEECCTRGVESPRVETDPHPVTRQRRERPSRRLRVFAYFLGSFRYLARPLDTLTPVRYTRGPSVNPWVTLGPRV